MAKSCKSTATRIYYGEAFEGFVTLNITSKQAISTGSVVASTPKTSPQSKVQSLVASRGSLSISPSYRQGIVRDEKLTRKLNSAARSPRIKNDFQTRLYPRDRKKNTSHTTQAGLADFSSDCLRKEKSSSGKWNGFRKFIAILAFRFARAKRGNSRLRL